MVCYGLLLNWLPLTGYFCGIHSLWSTIVTVVYSLRYAYTHCGLYSQRYTHCGTFFSVQLKDCFERTLEGLLVYYTSSTYPVSYPSPLVVCYFPFPRCSPSSYHAAVRFGNMVPRSNQENMQSAYIEAITNSPLYHY